MPKLPFVPFQRPSIGEEEISEVVETLRSGWITSGARTQQFEREFREYTQSSHSLALNSCTAALHVALVALGLGPGDEVITTPMTFCATVNSIIHTGATPVLADVDDDGNLDPQCVEEMITPRTKAIIPVHFAGLPCEMRAIWTLAHKHGLKVVEDAAHACGAWYQNLPIGQTQDPLCSDAVAFSFYATKNMTTGEGGMVTTPHEELAARMRVLALHGISKDAWNRYTAEGDWFYEVNEVGFKYNLSDIQSAIGIHQLRKLDRFIAERARLVARYNEAFTDCEELDLPHAVEGRKHAWHLYILKLRIEALSTTRAGFIKQLRHRNVGASVHFIPISMHRFFAPWAAANPCPKADYLYERSISLPLYPGLTEEEQDQVIKAVREIVSEQRPHFFAMAQGAMGTEPNAA